MFTSKSCDAGVVKLVGALIALEGISDASLQQQLIAKLRQVQRITAVQARSSLLQLVGLL